MNNFMVKMNINKKGQTNNKTKYNDTNEYANEQINVQ